MFVDLSSINNSDYKLEYQEKSKILLDYLGEPDGKFLIVPIHILNILQESTEFVSCEINSDISSIEKVGNINGYDCYVDIHMDSNEILLYYNKAKIRDSKLDYLLNSVELLEEKRVKIIS
jgi:hypothetical protein